MKKLEKMIKALQQELMITKELPHVESIRFLASVDKAERNLIRERKPDPVPPVVVPEQEEQPKEVETT